MKKRNRVVAIMLAAAMTMSMGMGTVSFAEGSAKDVEVGTVTDNLAKKTDRGSIIVRGVSTGTVKAYKVAEGIYDETTGYFQGYKPVKATGKTNVKDLDAGVLTGDIIANPGKYTSSGKIESIEGGVKFSDLEIGTYVIVVSGTTDARIYNPMMGSVYYDGNEKIMGTTIDAKYTEEVKDKNITKVDNVTVNGKVTDKIGLGSTVEFEVIGQVPNYNTDMYSDMAYELTDEPSTGLTIQTDTVKIYAKNTDPEAQNTYTLLDRADLESRKILSVAAGGIEFKLNKSNIADFLGKEIKITYAAKIGKAASNRYGNTLNLAYNNNPNEKRNDKEKKTGIITNLYDFDIDGKIEKVDENDKALGGAEFTLYTDPDCTQPFHYADDLKTNVTSTTTKTDNDIDFFDLPLGTKDENGYGVYYIKETGAPAGYQLTGKIFKAVIKPTWNTDGTLKDYDVDIYDISDLDHTISNVVNTKLAALPSTGGMGTYLFTIGGVVIMAGVTGLVIAKRRRDEE